MIKRTILMLCALLTCLGPAAELQSATHRQTIMIQERARKYMVHVPSNCTPDQKWPLIFVFHGGGGTAQAAMDEGGWIEKADQEKFILAVPEGTRKNSDRSARFVGNPQSWNDGSARTGLYAVKQGVDDVAFIDALLDRLIEQYPVDPQRVYTTGFSNGASMSFRLARECSDRFAAAAPVAGVDWLKTPNPRHPVPILFISGTADPLNPIRGGEIRIGRKFYGTKPPTLDMLKTWAGYHHCGSQPVETTISSGAVRNAFVGPNESEPVVCLALPGHGHHWPGGESKLPRWLAGENNTSLNATDTIWEFFKTHQLPAQPARTKTSGAGFRPE